VTTERAGGSTTRVSVSKPIPERVSSPFVTMRAFDSSRAEKIRIRSPESRAYTL